MLAMPTALRLASLITTLALSGCHLLLPLSSRPADGSGPPEGRVLEAGGPVELRAHDSARLEPGGACRSDCTMGCDSKGACFVPSNWKGPLPAACGTLTLAGSLDTTNCVFDACQGDRSGPICVIHAIRLQVGNLKVSGARPLLLAVDTDAVIQGVLDAGAHGVSPGPGGSPAGVTSSLTVSGHVVDRFDLMPK